MCRCSTRRSRRGVALVTVLWLTAALAIIGLTVASTVRGEVQRVETALDTAKAELLARGAIERMIHFLNNPPIAQPGQIADYRMGQQRMLWNFPGGDVMVELLPESGKLNVNSGTAAQLLSVLLASGYPAGQAQDLTAAIIDWRMVPAGGVSPMDSYYLSLSPTFQPRHSSFEQIEELLMVRGITSNVYYGGRERVPGGPVVARAGLRDVLSTFGGTNVYDANSAHSAILASTGITPAEVELIVGMRRRVPFTYESLNSLTLSGGPATRVLRAGQDQAYTIKATARPRRPDGQLSDFRLTAAILLGMEQFGNYQIPKVRSFQVASTTDTPWPEQPLLLRTVD